MAQASNTKRLHASVFRDRQSRSQEFLLSEEDFRFAAECERIRVTRNGSVLSLLLLYLPEESANEKDYAFLTRILEGRLRVTDTPGLLPDGRLGVLLPDTPAEGAWKVAEEISEVYPPGPGRPQCDVIVFPESPSHREAAEKENAPADQSALGLLKPSIENLFVRPTSKLKRSIDIVGSIVGLLGSTPILLSSALAMKLSSSEPVFFSQQREGQGGRPFTIWKLRTMCVGAEQLKSQLREHSHQDGPAFKMRKDPRTTKLGRFLRWASVDELPQFWNVLRGDMSLVGPRPLPTEESQAWM